MKLRLFAFALILITVSCSKNGNQPSSPISGTWVFQQQVTAVWPASFSSSYNFFYALPQSISGWSFIAKDTFNLSLDNSGNYTFTFPNHFPSAPLQWTTTKGTFRIIDDSLIIINQDTTLLNFSYPFVKTPFNGQYPNIRPYPNGDTIVFRQMTNDSLLLRQSWHSRNVFSTSQADSIGLYQTFTGFKRIK